MGREEEEKKILFLRIYGWPNSIVLAVKVSQGKTFIKSPEHYANDYPFWDAVAWAIQAVDTPCSERQGYESVLEHVTIQFVAKCSRICTHELIRHRHASYAQTSTRILGLEAFRADDKRIGLLYPLIVKAAGGDESAVKELCIIPSEHQDKVVNACVEYFRMILNAEGKGVDSSLRYAQPDALAAHIMVTTNLREVIHIAATRLHPHAHWEIRQLIEELLEKLWLEYKVPVHLMLVMKRPGLAKARHKVLEKALTQLETVIQYLDEDNSKKLRLLVRSIIGKESLESGTRGA